MKHITFLFLLFTATSFAQKPCFTVNANRGCVPFTIILTDCSNGGTNIKYQYDPAGNPTDTISNTTFTYTKPGTYKIVQWGSFNAQGDSTSRIIQVLPTPDPVFTVSFCAANQVVVKITDTVYDEFTIDFGDRTVLSPFFKQASVPHIYTDNSPKTITVSGFYSGLMCGKSGSQTITPLPDLIAPVWQSLQTPNATSFDLTFEGVNYLRYQLFQQAETGAEQLLTTFQKSTNPLFNFVAKNLDSTQVYQFRAKGLDDCGNEITSVSVAKLPLTVQSDSREMQISWKRYPVESEFRFYILLRNEQLLDFFDDISVTSFTDKDIVCGRKYCYRLVTQLANGLTSVSQNVCRIGQSNEIPPAVQNATATVENGKVLLTWQPPNNFTIKNYTISKSSGNTFNTDKNTLEDPENFEKRVCYKIQFEDSCGNRSIETTDICPIFLSQNPTSGKLEWSAYEGWQSVVQEYLVEKLNEQGQVMQTVSVGTSLEFADYQDFTTQTVIYRVRAVSGSLTSASNVIAIIQTARLSIPTAFSPNDDQWNNNFLADGIFIKEFRMTIYNRWGQAIFASDDLKKGWDGKLNDKPLPAESYVYTVEAQDFTGKLIKRQGTFMLLR